MITKMVSVFAHIYTKCLHEALLGGIQVECSVGEVICSGTHLFALCKEFSPTINTVRMLCVANYS